MRLVSRWEHAACDGRERRALRAIPGLRIDDPGQPASSSGHRLIQSVKSELPQWKCLICDGNFGIYLLLGNAALDDYRDMFRD